MKHYRLLQEISKFVAGLVAADFITLVWFAQTNLFPVNLFGAQFDQSIVVPGLIFDAALFLFLVHTGWNIGRIPRMRERSYLFIAGCVFAVVAAAHFLRLFSDTPLIIGGWSVPFGLSWVGVAFAVYLAYMSFFLAARLNTKR